MNDNTAQNTNQNMHQAVNQSANQTANQNANLALIKWVLCAIALLFALCAGGGVGSATSVSYGYMVRAVFIEQAEDGYTVAVLYQDPDPAANSAEVAAPFTITQAEGDSLAAAFATLEQTLAAPISYQLSDYLLLCGTPSLALLRDYAALVQSVQVGRYGAQVCYTAQGVAALALQAQQTPSLAEDLFDILTQSELQPAALFDAAQDSLVVPQIEQNAGGDFAPLQTSILLYQTGAVPYDATQTQLYRLLTGIGGTCYFVMGDVSVSIGTRLSSYSDVLAGVSDEITTLWSGNKSVENVNQSTQNTQGSNSSADAVLPTLHLYALVQSTSDASPDALVQMAQYIEDLANAQLAQLGVSGVEVSLYSLVN